MVRRSWSNAASSSKSPGTNRKPSASCFQTSSRNSVRACSFTESCTICAKSWSAQSRRAKPTRLKPGRQQPAVGEVVDRRHHLLARQVAGDAEEHHAAGAGDARQPAVLGVAQRVGPGHASTSRTTSRSPGPLTCSRSTGRPLLGEHLPVADGLRGEELLERERPVRHRQVGLRLAGDLQVDPGRRAALVVLPGRVQEARAPAEGDRPAGARGERVADRRPARRRGAGRGRPGRRRSRARASSPSSSAATASATVAAPSGSQPSRGVDGDRPVDERRASGEEPPPSSISRAACLGALDVGLVERVDPDHPAGDGGGVLPQQHLRAERARRRRRPSRTPGGPCRARDVGPEGGQHLVGRAGGEVGGVEGRRRRRAGCPCRPCRWTRRSSCSAQSPKPAYGAPASASTSLSTPARLAAPSRAPSRRPGLSTESASRAGPDGLGLVEQRRRCRRRPARSAPGRTR